MEMGDYMTNERYDKEKFISEIRNIVNSKIDISEEPDDEHIEELIRTEVFLKSKELYLSISEKTEIIRSVFNGMRRLDVLQPLIEDESITEIMVNGPNNIFVEKGGRVYQTDTVFESQQKLENVIQAIVSKVNRAVNEASPVVDARLEDGSRVNAVLPPIALNGPILTIRKFSKEPMTMGKLIQYGSITEEIAELLDQLVKARYNIFICGGTGSGKTTFLNALSNFIPSDERIVTIEDSAELQIANVKNLISLETRDANVEGRGEVTMRGLIKTSLRMRPDRIVVGEVRGSEAIDMLQAMNTGHDGSLSTGHANSTKDMISRLETMVLGGVNMPIEAIRQQIASALDIVVHLGRLRDKSRRVLEITEIGECIDGQIHLNPLFKFIETSVHETKVMGKLEYTGNTLIEDKKLAMAGIAWKGKLPK